MEHSVQTGGLTAILFSRARRAAVFVMFLLAACSTGGDDGSEPISPLTTPMALVVNQDDTTLTTLRLDGKHSPVVNTLSLGPVQPDAIGGVAFSLGEWIFITNTETNKVAAIDPISALTPILEELLDVNGPVRLGQRPSRIYRDPADKEVLWTMNEGDPGPGLDTGRDTRTPCLNGGSVSLLHNSHLSVGGERPHVVTTQCLSGRGDHVIAFGTLASKQIAFVTSKTTGLVSLLLADETDGDQRGIEFIRLDLCDDAGEQLLGFPVCDTGSSAYRTPNHSAPAGIFWSQTTGNIYSYLSGYGTVVEIDPKLLTITQRRVDLTPMAPHTTMYHSVGITPDGRFLLLAGEDILADLISSAPNVCQANPKVYGRLAVVDLTVPTLSVQPLSVPQLDNIRPVHFQFTPDGRRLYLTQSNKVNDLPCAAQAGNVKKDKLLVFDPSTFPAAPAFVAEVDLPPVGPDGLHGMDVWATGPRGAGSAKGVVVTNAQPGSPGSVSLINAASNAITATIPVGRNPKQVTVYYYGLAASDNQATPIW